MWFCGNVWSCLDDLCTVGVHARLFHWGLGLKVKAENDYYTGHDNAVSTECFLKYKLISFGMKGQIVVVV